MQPSSQETVGREVNDQAIIAVSLTFMPLEELPALVMPLVAVSD